MDKYSRTDLPDFKQEPKLFKLVKTFQIHCHTKICQIVKIIIVDFRTIAEPLSEELPSHEKLPILEKSSLVLKKVKTYIDKK